MEKILGKILTEALASIVALLAEINGKLGPTPMNLASPAPPPPVAPQGHLPQQGLVAAGPSRKELIGKSLVAICQAEGSNDKALSIMALFKNQETGAPPATLLKHVAESDYTALEAAIAAASVPAAKVGSIL